MQPINAFNPPAVLFAGHTRRLRDKSIFKKGGAIDDMDSQSVLRGLNQCSPQSTRGALPTRLQRDAGIQFDRLLGRLVSIIENLPSGKSAERLYTRLKGLKHFSLDNTPGVKKALANALPPKSCRIEKEPNKPELELQHSLDELFLELGLEERPKHNPGERELEQFNWGRPIVASTGGY